MSLILSGTDGLSDVDGSAATPAIRGTDANTGIFFPAADTIAFAEGGAEVARFDASGNLLVGGTNTYGGIRTVIAGAGVTASTGSGSNNIVASLYDTTAGAINVGGGLGFQGNDGVNLAVTFATINGSKENATSGNFASYLSFKTRADGGSLTERARITSGGNLLVGTTDVSMYDTNAGADVGGFYRFISTGGGGSANYGFTVSNGSGDSAMGLWGLNSASKRLRINSIKGEYTSNTAGSEAAYMAFSTIRSGTLSEAARIDSSGNLLVGSTSSATGARLSVVQTTSNVITANIQSTASSPAYCMDLQTSGSAAGGGTFLRGFASGPTQTLNISNNGNITNTNNSYGAISDVKLKENIVDATPKLANLMQVKVRNYNMIGDTTKQIGVVAQELETVFPAMVDESIDSDKEGNDLGTTTKSVKYSVFVPMLIKAIQEQQAIIESLKARLDAANL